MPAVGPGLRVWMASMVTTTAWWGGFMPRSVAKATALSNAGPESCSVGVPRNRNPSRASRSMTATAILDPARILARVCPPVFSLKISEGN